MAKTGSADEVMTMMKLLAFTSFLSSSYERKLDLGVNYPAFEGSFPAMPNQTRKSLSHYQITSVSQTAIIFFSISSCGLGGEWNLDVFRRVLCMVALVYAVALKLTISLGVSKPFEASIVPRAMRIQRITLATKHQRLLEGCDLGLKRHENLWIDIIKPPTYRYTSSKPHVSKNFLIKAWFISGDRARNLHWRWIGILC